MIACKEKKKCFTLELNVHGIYRKTVFFSSLKKTYNVVTKVLEMLIICIIDFFFCKYTSILCYTPQSFGYKD